MSVTSVKHTPGPWTVGGPVAYGRDILGADDIWVGNAHGPHDGKGGFPTDTELEVNARLIAAAPELLAALEDTMCRVCDLYIGEPERDGEEPCYMCAKARAAVTKARGGGG